MVDRYRRQIGEQRRPDVRVQNAAGPDAFGTGIGAAVGGLGNTLQGAGDRLAQIELKERVELDEAKVAEWGAKYQEELLDFMQNPETGQLLRMGGNAAGVAQAVADFTRGKREAYLGLAKNERQRRGLDQYIVRAAFPYMEQAKRHEGAELLAYQVDAQTAKVRSDDQLALSSPLDRNAWDSAADNTRDAMRELQRLQGWSDEQTEQATAGILSDRGRRVLLQVASTDPLRAQEMLGGASWLLPEDAAWVGEKIRGDVERQQAREAAQALLNKHDLRTADGLEAALGEIAGTFAPDLADRVKAELFRAADEAGMIEGLRQKELQERQNANWMQLEDDFEAGKPFTFDQLEDLAARGEIGPAQRRQGERMIALRAGRFEIGRGLQAKEPEAWEAMSEEAREQAVMRAKGRTEEQRRSKLQALRAGVVDPLRSAAAMKREIHDAYEDMYITRAERDNLIEVQGNFTNERRRIVFKQQNALQGNMQVFCAQSPYAAEDKQYLERADVLFLSEVALLDPDSDTYLEDVQRARRNAVAKTIDEREGAMRDVFSGNAAARELYKRIKAGTDEPSAAFSPKFHTDPIDLSRQSSKRTEGNSAFESGVSEVLKSEGGYSNDPDDRGGETNLGITAGTLAVAHKKGIVGHADPKKLTREEAKAIYKRLYWDPIQADNLPDGLNYMLFDMAVNHGTSGAARMLQDVLGVKKTGKIDAATLAALESQDLYDVLGHLYERRGAFYKSLIAKKPAQKKFARGWTNRNKRVYERSLDLAGEIMEPDWANWR